MNKVIVKTEDLKRILESVKNGTSKEKFRPVFTGIYIEIEKTTLTMVACDGYKLFTSNCEIISGNEFKVITPIFKIPKNAEKETVIQVDNEFITFDFTNEKHTFRTIKGEFIDWKSMLNKQNTFKIRFNPKYLQDALKGEKGPVDLEFSDDISPVVIYGNGKKLVLPMRRLEEKEKN